MNRGKNFRAYGPRQLEITKLGLGSGTVTSLPSGIDCGDNCAHEFPFGTVVELTAIADADSLFKGWTGCSRTWGTCKITLNGDNATVTATFKKK